MLRFENGTNFRNTLAKTGASSLQALGWLLNKAITYVNYGKIWKRHESSLQALRWILSKAKTFVDYVKIWKRHELSEHISENWGVISPSIKMNFLRSFSSTLLIFLPPWRHFSHVLKGPLDVERHQHQFPHMRRINMFCITCYMNSGH